MGIKAPTACRMANNENYEEWQKKTSSAKIHSAIRLKSKYNQIIKATPFTPTIFL